MVHLLLVTRSRHLLIFKAMMKGRGHQQHIIVKHGKHNTDWTVLARMAKLGTHTTYDKMTPPTYFELQGSKARVSRYILLLNLGLLGAFVIGLSRISSCFSCKHDTDWTVLARTVKPGTPATYDKKMTPIDFQGQGSEARVSRYIWLINLVNVIQTEPC